jgi:hypothetical protein
VNEGNVSEGMKVKEGTQRNGRKVKEGNVIVKERK